MRMSYVLCFLMAAFSTPVVAADADLKQEVQKITSDQIESFNKHDPAGMAAPYVADGFLVNPTGLHADIAEFYKGVFKAGIDHEEATLDQVWPLGSDGAVALGQYRVTGKDQSGAPVDRAGFWTTVYVRENGKLKARMTSAFPKAPTPKD